jgi:P-type conjugative transfer protein TrbJ
MKKRPWLAKTVGAGVTVMVFTVTAVCPPPARAAVGLFATEITQLLNHIELIDQYLQQVQMVSNQLQQIQNMIRNTTVNPSQLFGTVAQDLTTLGNAVQGANALAYSMGNLDSQFTQRFPGYQAVATNYGTQYSRWTNTALQTISSTLRGMGLQSSQLQNEQTILNALRIRSENPIGMSDTVAAGNQIAEQQVEQMQKLRELMLLDLQSKQAYQAAELQDQMSTHANMDNMFGQSQISHGSGTVF